MKGQTYEMSMLYDFYGDLLTERQKEFFDLYYNEDLSLGEIAENSGITRQGVRDVIVRAEAILTEMEEKTGAIARFQAQTREADEILAAAERLLTVNRHYQDREIGTLANQIRQAALRIKE
ncbi:MAG: YlxM family DNA-binding protein [Oscillospiraceae bacterium]|nr:YlxM family DNA-binding protein [Oscillospiraceae bacterium]